MLPQNEKDKLYNHYEEECQKYFNKVYPGLKRILNEGYEKFRDALNVLYDLHIFQNYLLDAQEEYFKREASICISTFYSKTASDILCLYECLRQGQIISSMVIERNIFESFVNLKLILQSNTKERIKLYEDFAIVQRWNRIKEFEEYIEKQKKAGILSDEKLKEEEDRLKKVINEEERKRINEDYEVIKNNYLEGRPFHWAWKIFNNELQKGRNPSLSFICDKLGISAAYLQVYSLNSIIVHSESLMTNMLVQNGGITSVANFNDNLKSIAASSMSLAIDIILMVLHYAKSPKYEEVRYYLEEKWNRIF
jgi:hypothetical protein